MKALMKDAGRRCPETQAIKYTGSKLRLLPYIMTLAEKAHPRTVFDGFSGSTRVSQAFSCNGCQVYANDIAVYSKIFNTAWLLNKREAASYQELIDHLNALEPVDGWFTEYYGGENNGPANIQGIKFPWQKKNTRKLDAVREEIDRLGLDEVSKAVAISSLILALDRVDNTIGHFVSYLNNWSVRSYGDLKLEVPRLWLNEQENTVINEDIFKAINHIPVVDLAYLDPPYGSNNRKMPPSRVRYASYYHIWTTVCLNDRPKLFGRARRREDTSDLVAGSVFENYRRTPAGRYIALEAIEQLIREIKARHIILSYSSGGLASAAELGEVLNAFGTVIETEKINYRKNVMAVMKWTNDWVKDTAEKNIEYLFLMEKS